MSNVEKLMAWLSTATSKNPISAFDIGVNCFQFASATSKESIRRNVRYIVAAARADGHEICCSARGYWLPKSTRDERESRQFLIAQGTRIMRTAGTLTPKPREQERLEI